MSRPLGETGVNVILPTSEPDETIGMLKKTSKQPSDDTRVARGPDPRPSDEENDDLFNCPEEGCIKTFRTHQNLQRHVDFGRHQIKLNKESQYDQISGK